MVTNTSEEPGHGRREDTIKHPATTSHLKGAVPLTALFFCTGSPCYIYVNRGYIPVRFATRLIVVLYIQTVVIA